MNSNEGFKITYCTHCGHLIQDCCCEATPSNEPSCEHRYEADKEGHPHCVKCGKYAYGDEYKKPSPTKTMGGDEEAELSKELMACPYHTSSEIAMWLIAKGYSKSGFHRDVPSLMPLDRTRLIDLIYVSTMATVVMAHPVMDGKDAKVLSEQLADDILCEFSNPAVPSLVALDEKLVLDTIKQHFGFDRVNLSSDNKAKEEAEAVINWIYFEGLAKAIVAKFSNPAVPDVGGLVEALELVKETWRTEDTADSFRNTMEFEVMPKIWEALTAFRTAQKGRNA